MEQAGLGGADGVGEAMSVADAVAAPVGKTSGYDSDGEESEFSMSDSVHYSGSEFGDDEDGCSDDDCSRCGDERTAEGRPNSAAEQEPIQTVEPQQPSEAQRSRELLPVQAPRRLTPEEVTRVHLCNRTLSTINYGPYRIFFDIEFDGDFIGRIIITLANHVVDCRKRFDKLCTGNMRRRDQLNMHFTKTKIHRMVDGKFLEGGVLNPLIAENADSLYNETPVLGDPLYYDSYIMIANKNADDAYGGARFFITTTANVRHYDANHVPVGCVVTGTEVIDMITTFPRDENGYFNSAITIGHCGSIKKSREEQMACGKYEKSARKHKNFYPYKLHRRPNKAKRFKNLSRNA